MSERLDGAAGIVTGAGRGIGAAIVRELAARGARLVAADLRAEALADVAATTEAIIPVAADVREVAGSERLRDTCLERFGRIDFAIANAGVANASSLADGDPAHWRAVIETNVLGVAYTIRAVLPTMLQQRDGHIVLMASVSGRESYVGEPIYCASKWAVVGLGHALRKETVGSGVRVTLIEPGVVDTPLVRSNPFALAWLETITPLQDQDVARAVAFALTQPKHMAINELVLRPIAQEV
jgi:NADP-dependent 3-hydroxy acid dehydrogenase YdfG